MSTEAPAPQGDYVPAVLHAGVVYTAGMTPRRDGRLVLTGAVGGQLSLEQGRSAAALAAANAIAAAWSVVPSGAGLRCLQMTVYIVAATGFTDLSAVADGASAAIARTLAPSALPARAAIGVATLPSGAPVEVALIAAVTDPVHGA
ncbi:RidA family protein [Mycolicibacterium baixiangningiae]|uniref:RidA family protein n=1 Tax=Mycolicibacterium baixiangningiae TaxID=2761578 RepID=UPI001E495896|nr:RidA family protein [Mycolicibacterium baixiangningiae]